MPYSMLTGYSKVQLEEYLQLQAISPAIMTAEYVRRQLQDPNSPLSKQFINLNIFAYLLWQHMVNITIQHQRKTQLTLALQRIYDDVMQQNNTDPQAAAAKSKVMRTAEAYAAGDKLRKLDTDIDSLDFQLNKLKKEISNLAKQQANELGSLLISETQAIVDALNDYNDSATTEPVVKQQLPALIKEAEHLQTKYAPQERQDFQAGSRPRYTAQPKPAFNSSNLELDEVSTAMHNPLMQELELVLFIKRIPAPLYLSIAPLFKRNVDAVVEKKMHEMQALRDRGKKMAQEKYTLEQQLQTQITQALNPEHVEQTVDNKAAQDVNPSKK